MPRERLPRQSILSLGTTLPNVTTTTPLTSATSNATSSSIPADPTTTSSSAETTSTLQSSTSTTSQAPTSSSSSTPSPSPPTSTLSPSPPTSSSFTFVPPATTTEPPTPPSSQQGTPTTITSAYTTYFNGSTILTQTMIPSTIPQVSSPSSSDRTAIIAASAAGGTALIVLLLSLAFCARRKQFKRLDILNALTLKRKQERSRATLLDGEDLDDVDLARPPLRYTDASMATPGTPPHTLSRWSEVGSTFRSREDLWPPPNEGTRLMDHRDDLDLSRIVDDVMGPSSPAVHFSHQSVSSVHRGSMVESEVGVHSRTVSNASNAALLEAAGLTAGAVPVRPSPLARPGTQSGSVAHPTGDIS